MKPEEKARERIDQMLEEAGWEVVDRKEITTGMQAQAVREALCDGNLEADYMLFVGNRAVGVLEAKRVEVDVNTPVVQQQAIAYTHKVPDWCHTWYHPLPIVYVSNGKKTYLLNQGTDKCVADDDWQEVHTIMSPKAIVELLGLEGEFVKLPALRKRGLRDCQYEAIRSLEAGFMAGKKRALIVLATGAGKTYTACLAAYRMLAYTPAKRVLFLVDRNNLGKQAEDGFGTFKLTETGESFSNIYGVERMRKATFGKDSNVIISTIQRLFSVLTGEEYLGTDDNEEQDFDHDDEQTIVQLDPKSLKLAPDTFDLIIVDECHRSIYSQWRQVLEYFSAARIIGLTATPSELTLPFFNNNLVSQYTLEQSIVDGVNVPCRVYSIETQITAEGGKIKQDEKVIETVKYTGTDHQVEMWEDLEYSATDVNRNIIVPAQIDLIIRTFHDCIYRDLYPQRAEKDPEMKYIPKTLIYALNDQHATNIVESIRKIFRPEDERFVQKITYSAGDSNQLIRSFRNDKEFRIAVTVTLVATGTDVKPLEIVMFMRDVNSELLYTQMKGRGVRTIGDEQLRTVTPNADTKDMFYLVDAAGVTKHDHTIPRGNKPQQKYESLEHLLEKIVMGNLDDDILYDLASRMSRIHNRSTLDKQVEWENLAGISLQEMALNIFKALGYGEDGVNSAAFISEDGSEHMGETKDSGLTHDERMQLVLILTSSPSLRQKLLELNRGYIHTLNPGEDQLISQGFSTEEARSAIDSFEAYVREHKDEQEALRILYNHTGEPITYEMLLDLNRKLMAADIHFHPNQLWNYYALLDPKHVVPFKHKDEREAITNIICLVRYALEQTDRLQSLTASGSRLFNLWCGQMQRELTYEQKQLMSEVLEYVIHNGSCLFDAPYKQANQTLAMQLIKAFGNDKTSVKMAVLSLSTFIINNAKLA